MNYRNVKLLLNKIVAGQSVKNISLVMLRLISGINNNNFVLIIYLSKSRFLATDQVHTKILHYIIKSVHF